MDTFRYYLPVVILILIAILVIAVPEILVAFLASLIIMAGIGALLIGHKIRKSGIDLQSTDDRLSDEDFFGRRFGGRPILEIGIDGSNNLSR